LIYNKAPGSSTASGGFVVSATGYTNGQRNHGKSAKIVDVEFHCPDVPFQGNEPNGYRGTKHAQLKPLFPAVYMNKRTASKPKDLHELPGSKIVRPILYNAFAVDTVSIMKFRIFANIFPQQWFPALGQHFRLGITFGNYLASTTHSPNNAGTESNGEKNKQYQQGVVIPHGFAFYLIRTFKVRVSDR
jgi:hypothetical protein